MRSYILAGTVVAALFVALPAFAGWATFTLKPPTLDTDGRPLQSGDVVAYRFEWGGRPDALTNSVVLDPAPEFLVEALPDAGTLYFAASAIHRSGVPGPRSNVACRNMSGGTCLAAPFHTDVTEVRLSEPSPLAFDAALSITAANETYKLEVTNRSSRRITHIRVTLAPSAAEFDNAQNPGGGLAATIAPSIGRTNNGVRANEITFTLGTPMATGTTFVRTGDIDGGMTGATIRVTFEGGQNTTKQVMP